jgi:hypothetical protein
MINALFQNKVTKMLGNWRQRFLTEIGRTNIFCAQVLPHITFVGSSIGLPDRYEKLPNTQLFHFLWGAHTEKERCALCIKKKTEGGLAMPHIASKLRAIKSGWVQKLRQQEGIFKLAFVDTLLYNAEDAVFCTPMPMTGGHDYANECVDAWSETLNILDVDHNGLIWPLFDPHHRAVAKRKIPHVTITEAASGEWPSMNFLEQARITTEAKRVLSNLEKDRRARRKKVCNTLHSNIICDKWTASDTIKQTIIEEELFSKHGGKAIRDYNSQKKQYWLHVDQVKSPFPKFRGMIEEEFAQVWGKIDGRQLFTQSRLESFQWRGYHGKLYAQKDLLRFGYTSDSKCNYCEVSVQTVHHLFVECPRSQLLFRNFRGSTSLMMG